VPLSGFHLIKVLVTHVREQDLLQQVADGQLTRLIVCCPPRHGKSQLVSGLFPAYWVRRHPGLFCAIDTKLAGLAPEKL
jgi:hypothetical protein